MVFQEKNHVKWARTDIFFKIIGRELNPMNLKSVIRWEKIVNATEDGYIKCILTILLNSLNKVFLYDFFLKL